MEKFVLSCRYGVDFSFHNEYSFRKNNVSLPIPQPFSKFENLSHNSPENTLDYQFVKTVCRILKKEDC